MKKIIQWLTVLGVLLGAALTPALAAEERSFNFEDYTRDAADGQTPPSAWVLQNNDSNLAGVYSIKTDRGISVKMDCQTQKYFQMRHNISPAMTGTVTMEVSLQMKDYSNARAIGLREGSNGLKNVVMFQPDKSISVFGKAISGAAYALDQWYDVKITYNLETGVYYVFVYGGGEKYSATGVTKYADLSKLESVYITYQGLTDLKTVTYVDDVHLYKSAALLPITSEGVDFTGFTGSEDGQTNPPGMTLTNTTAGESGVWGEALEGSVRGTSLKAFSSTARNFEIRKYFSAISGQATVTTDIYIPDLNLKSRQLYFRGPYVNGAPVVTVGADFISEGQQIMVGGKAIGTFQLNTWYSVQMDLNVEERTIATTVWGDDGSVFRGNGNIPQNGAPIDGYVMVMFPSNRAGSYTYYDNFGLETPSPLQMLYSLPFRNQNFIHVSSELEVGFSGSVDRASLLPGSIALNDVPLQPGEYYLKNVSTIGIKPIQPLAEDTAYTLTITGIEGYDGSSLTVSVPFKTGKGFFIGKMAYANQEGALDTMAPGPVKTVLSGVAYDNTPHSVVCMMVLFEKDTNRMVAADLKTIEVGSAYQNYEASLTVPADAENYYIETYLWDGLDSIGSLQDKAVLR